MIQAIYFDNGASQFSNVGKGRSRGVSFELGGHPRPWLEPNAGFTWEGAKLDEAGPHLLNSPAYITKLRWLVPLGHRLTLANNEQWISSRWAYDGDKTRPVLLAAFTLTLRRLAAGCDLQLGVRNALNWSYTTPWGCPSTIFPATPGRPT